MRRTVLGSTTKFWPERPARVESVRRQQLGDVPPAEGHQVMRTLMMPAATGAISANCSSSRSMIALPYGPAVRHDAPGRRARLHVHHSDDGPLRQGAVRTRTLAPLGIGVVVAMEGAPPVLHVHRDRRLARIHRHARRRRRTRPARCRARSSSATSSRSWWAWASQSSSASASRWSSASAWSARPSLRQSPRRRRSPAAGSVRPSRRARPPGRDRPRQVKRRPLRSSILTPRRGRRSSRRATRRTPPRERRLSRAPQRRCDAARRE